MKPIYFPFTYISKPVVEALRACFRQFVVYQPSFQQVPEKMQAWEKSGILDIRVPVQGNENKLEALLKDYKTWANLHNGETAFFKTQADKIPFFDDYSTSQIKADIKKKGQGQKSEDFLFNARIFLHIAQEFDMQDWEINRDILLFEEMEQNLIKSLKGNNGILYKKDTVNKALIDDTGDYMTADRIKAWAHIMRYDREISELFITSSTSVFDHLIDKAPEAKIVHRFDSIPVHKNRIEQIERWQDDLMQYLDNLAKNSWPVSVDGIIKAPVDKECNSKVSLTLCLVPGETPLEFFARCVKDKSAEGGKTNEEARFKNTLIGLIEG